MNNKILNWLYKEGGKLLICSIVFLFIGIAAKGSKKYADIIYNELYVRNINFASVRKFYNQYLGGVLSLSMLEGIESVFNEELKYNSKKEYEDGVELEVGTSYLVPNIVDGIVVFVGKKDKYQSVVMVEDRNGIDLWYGNVCSTSLKLYDNIKAGDYVGEVCDNKLYLVVSKGNTFLNFDSYYDGIRS